MSFEAHGAVQGKPSQSSTPAPEAPAAAPAAAAPEAGASAGAAPVETPPAQAGAAQESAQATPAEFKTDFKIKVMDQEHEVDEFLRGAIKDEKSWNRVKELYEKSLGLDVVKPKYAETKKLAEEYQTKLQAFEGEVHQLRQVYQAGDFDTFFQKLKIPEEKVFQWVMEKAQYQELPPEQRKILDERRQYKLQNLELASERERLQTQMQEQESKALGFMLRVELDKPDVKSFAEKFDSRAGKPGAFAQAVVEYGEQAFYASRGQVVLTPEQAVAKTLERYKPFFVEAPGMPQAQPVSTPAPAPAQRPKVLPTLTSKASTAVAPPRPKSIEDLKKLHKEMSGLS